jgi:hypothetical protein
MVLFALSLSFFRMIDNEIAKEVKRSMNVTNQHFIPKHLSD